MCEEGTQARRRGTGSDRQTEATERGAASKTHKEWGVVGKRSKSSRKQSDVKGKKVPSLQPSSTSESKTDDTAPQTTKRRRQYSQSPRNPRKYETESTQRGPSLQTHKEQDDVGKISKSTPKERGVNSKRVPSLTAVEPSSTSERSTDHTSPDKTECRRQCTQSPTNASINEDNETLLMLKLLNVKIDKHLKQTTESKDDISKIRKESSEMHKELEKVLENQNVILENQNVQSKELKKLRKQLELQTNNTSHASDAPRPESNHLQLLNVKFDKQLEQTTASKNDTSEMRKELQKVLENQNVQSKELKKLCKQLELQTNDTSHASDAPRPESNQLQLLIVKFDKQLEQTTASKNDISEMRKELQKVLENQNVLTKEFEKICKQSELHTNDTSHASDGPRSQPDQLQPPRFRLQLKFTSGEMDTIDKDQRLDISVALVEGNNNQPVQNEPLASAKVQLVVVNSKFNKHNNQYNWSKQDFECCIKKPHDGNTAKRDVDQPVKSIVSNSCFDLKGGVGRNQKCTIFENSTNSKVRLGVMVVSPTGERVLEGLSKPFFVRGHDRPARQNNLRQNSSYKQEFDTNGGQSPLPSVRNSANPLISSYKQTGMERVAEAIRRQKRSVVNDGQTQFPFVGNSESSNRQEQLDFIPQDKGLELARQSQDMYYQHGSVVNGGQAQFSIVGNSESSNRQGQQDLIPRDKGPELARKSQDMYYHHGSGLTKGQAQFPSVGNSEQSNRQEQQDLIPRGKDPQLARKSQDMYYQHGSGLNGGQTQFPFVGNSEQSNRQEQQDLIPRDKDPESARQSQDMYYQQGSGLNGGQAQFPFIGNSEQSNIESCASLY